MHERPVLSVVVPCFNESQLLEKSCKQLLDTLKKFATSFEIIFVDNGGTDNQLEIMKNLHNKHPNIVRIVSLTRNFGYQMSMSAGLEYAQGDAVVLIDADLQDPPEMIEDFLKKWHEGYQVVYGVRVKREAPFFMKLAYSLFYYLLRYFSDAPIPLGASEFGLMDRKVVDTINSLPERIRMIRALRGWIGYKQIGIPYKRESRKIGKTKFRLVDSLALGLDGILSVSTRVLTVCSLFGLMIVGFSFCLFFYILFWKFFNHQEIPGYAAIMTTITFFSGVIIGLIGLVGMVVERIFMESKLRPKFLVKSAIGFNQELSNDNDLGSIPTAQFDREDHIESQITVKN